MNARKAVAIIATVIGLAALAVGLPWLFLHPSGPGCNLETPTEPPSEPAVADETGAP